MIIPFTSMRMWWRSGLLILLLGLQLSAAQAQQKVQVVTRTLEQSWSFRPGMSVTIRAEKATIRVQGWDKPTVQVVLRLSARHPEQAVAEQDLPVARYRLQQTGNVLYLLNFFTLPAGASAVRSDLRAEYTVMMPAGSPLKIVNTYGQTELTDLTGQQELEQSFGKIALRNLRGTLTVTARYADLTATNLQASFTCEANKSAVQLVGLGGDCTVHNYYGSVRVQPTASLQKLTVVADRTEVTISAAQPELFAYQLNVQQGALAVPPAYATSKKGNVSRASLTVAAGTSRSLVRVSTSYAPLTLQTQPLSPQF
ncbi:hypothetical protein [Hymenobacter sp. GOD-10R]|uniref:hypothetical protein n=1 Tax=Hymenobacter sp. GOD-10R TaxID=3093922 RepID=UPI002D78B26B|nr:hypothetical protein [Hymenobacter sp. GOD-10R]WRQ26582.1 hypothetical protein SD425_16035 [Hymenobacter sp. GOD-10R]